MITALLIAALLAPQPAAVVFDGEWSDAERADVLVGVQRGLDFWQPTPRPVFFTAYDAGLGPPDCAPVYHDTLTIIMTKRHGVSYAIDGGRCMVIKAGGDGWQLPTPEDRVGFLVAHEFGHAWWNLDHFDGQHCPMDIMAGDKDKAYLAWYVGECTRQALEAL